MNWFRDSVIYFLAALSMLVPASTQQLTIKGRVVIDDGETRKSHVGEGAGAVVWLEPTYGDARAWPTADKAYSLVQRDHAFEPHVLVVPVGARVQFPNQDPIFHNVFSMFQAKRFDLGLYEGGTSKAIVFDKPGISYIFCNIHEQMGAVVIALTTPYYGISAANGIVTIEHVPAGRYLMKFWAEGASDQMLEALTREIVVTHDEDLGEVQIKVTPPVNLTHMNKFGYPYNAVSRPYRGRF